MNGQVWVEERVAVVAQIGGQGIVLDVAQQREHYGSEKQEWRQQAKVTPLIRPRGPAQTTKLLFVPDL